MEPDKAAGPDGFAARFLKSCRKIVKNDLHKLVLKYQVATRLVVAQIIIFLLSSLKKNGASPLIDLGQFLSVILATKL